VREHLIIRMIHFLYFKAMLVFEWGLFFDGDG